MTAKLTYPVSAAKFIATIKRALQFFVGFIILADNTFLPINFTAGNCRFIEPAVTKQFSYTERPLVGHNV